MDQHKAKVETIAARVTHFHAAKKPFRIYHGGTNSTRITTFSEDNSIDTSMLKDIISIDQEHGTCLVESNVPMDALVVSTLPMGFMPPVVPEFKGITVGGAFSGTGGESSSFRHGFFDRTVNWFEIILADGQVITASPSSSASLFYGAAGTFGTLGIITMLEIRLLPAKSHVELTYIPVTSVSEAQTEMDRLSNAEIPVDFIDALMLSRNTGVVCSGTLVNIEECSHSLAPEKTSFSGPWDQWFYIHAQSVFSSLLDSKSSKKEVMSLTEYFFRYDRGAFWAGQFVFEWFGVPFNRFTRYLLNWLMPTRTLYHGLHASGLGARYIIQDLCFPQSKVDEFTTWLDENYQIYPLWLCSVRQNDRISMNPHMPSDSQPGQTTGETMLNIGVWGGCPSGSNKITANRQLEAKVRSLGGMKWLYADSYYTEAEFWSIYNREWYEKLRIEHNAASLPTVYEKVITKQRPEAWVPCNLQTTSELFTGKKGLRDLWNGVWTIWPLVGVSAVMSFLRGEEFLKRKLD